MISGPGGVSNYVVEVIASTAYFVVAEIFVRGLRTAMLAALGKVGTNMVDAPEV